MSKAINNRCDFVLFFDVKDGNPNGDPDAGNLPRVDPETGHGLVTDVCLKRKVRNYVMLSKSEDEGFDIFVKEKGILNQEIERSYTSSDKVKEAVRAWQVWRKDKKNQEPERHYEDVAKEWMCENYYDIRAFGAVMSTGDDKEDEESKSKIRMTAGQVRGPIQLTFARSVDQIVTLEHGITRMAVTNERDLEKERTMGRKFTVPYGLYRCHGFVSAPFAAQTGFSDDDLSLFWKALLEMFEHDHSAARGQMATRKLVAFKHDSELGNAPAHKLFDMVKAEAKTKPVRDFGDYRISVPSQSDMPKGVTLEVKL
ncbi:MAG: type I-C CRISPR-associated protein Cas7/Csd2 [Candidatus Eisenbacteria bacterium]|nr:type I-C CRISPR-associated protein Cas7/Csd2 [Candidatus Eisenbacteria bacterium]